MISYTGTLLKFDGIPDSQGDIFSTDTSIELPSHEVPVLFEFHQSPEFLLGYAKLYFSQNEIRYDMRIDDTKLPKHALDGLIPCIGGSILKRTGNHADQVKVNCTGLSIKDNVDFRIKSIGEQK